MRFMGSVLTGLTPGCLGSRSSGSASSLDPRARKRPLAANPALWHRESAHLTWQLRLSGHQCPQSVITLSGSLIEPLQNNSALLKCKGAKEGIALTHTRIINACAQDQTS